MLQNLGKAFKSHCNKPTENVCYILNSFCPPVFPAAAPPAVPEGRSKKSGQEAGNQRPEAAG